MSIETVKANNKRVVELSENKADLEAVTLLIQYVGWAVANHPRELIDAVYGNHAGGYLNEKTNAIIRNFFGWWCDLSNHYREEAVRFAVERYAKENG